MRSACALTVRLGARRHKTKRHGRNVWWPLVLASRAKARHQRVPHRCIRATNRRREPPPDRHLPRPVGDPRHPPRGGAYARQTLEARHRLIATYPVPSATPPCAAASLPSRPSRVRACVPGPSYGNARTFLPPVLHRREASGGQGLPKVLAFVGAACSGEHGLEEHSSWGGEEGTDGRGLDHPRAS